MMAGQRLFLLGGHTTTFEEFAEEFVPAAGGSGAIVALLLAGGQGWEDYVPRYTQPWVRRGVKQIHAIVPDGPIIFRRWQCSLCQMDLSNS